MWGNNIVWGNGLIGLSLDDDNIVWGNHDDDNIVWGNLHDDNIVWGNLFDDNIVWGNSDDDNIVWGNGLDDDNIVWGNSAELGNVVQVGRRRGRRQGHERTGAPHARSEGRGELMATHIPTSLRVETMMPLPIATSTQTVSSDWKQGVTALQGKGITLRELRVSDAASLLTLLTTEEVTRFISPPPTTIEGFERFIQWAQHERAGGPVYLLRGGAGRLRHGRGPVPGAAVGSDLWDGGMGLCDRLGVLGLGPLSGGRGAGDRVCV